MAMYDEIPVYRYRLVDYVGDGFLIGAAGGSAFHFTRGLRSSPHGGRLAGGVRAILTNAPRVAGRGAAHLAAFCAFESAMSLARRREDHWNSIAAGAATFGLINMRRGTASAARSTLLGATLFVGVAGVYWNFELWYSRIMSWRKTRTYRGLPAPAAITALRTAHGNDPAGDFILYG